MRRSGCPFTIRDYSIKIEDKVSEEAVAIKGLTEMSVDVESETEDGRSGDSAWAETFVKCRSVKGTLTGRPISDRVTGLSDPGQALMHRAAMNSGGCEADQTLIIADAIGHCVRYDCVVTGETRSSDEDGENIRWDFEGVGAPEELGYVQATKIGFDRESLSITEGQTQELKVQFTPANASNQRYSYSIADEGTVALNAIDGANLSLRGVKRGSTQLSVRSMNNNLTARLNITVTAAV